MKPNYGASAVVKLICLAFPLAYYSVAIGQQCGPEQYVYGENGIIDELTTCVLARSFDLDLTPHSEHIKSTGRSLVDQGLSNKTSILHARLGGLWSARRADFVETGWKCDRDKVSSEALIELTGLSLEVIEKLDISMHRGQQHKLAAHKPCRTFDLPTWMCREQKAVYRTMSTWVNRAYFSLHLVQNRTQLKPSVEKLALMFTCPETFRQKINYSPSATYVLTRHMQPAPGQRGGEKTKRQTEEPESLGERASSHTITQSGKQPAVPPYHNSVRVIQRHATEALRSSIVDCINSIDSDLTLLAEHNSFTANKYNQLESGNEGGSPKPGTGEPLEEKWPSAGPAPGLIGECSSGVWLKNRVELSEQASALASAQFAPQAPQQQQQGQGSHSKRSHFLLDYPSDPNQLLNPYGYYHENSALDLMIDDNHGGGGSDHLRSGH